MQSEFVFCELCFLLLVRKEIQRLSKAHCGTKWGKSIFFMGKMDPNLHHLLRVHWCIGSRSGTSHSIHIAISLGAPAAISFSVFLTLFSKFCAPEFFF